MAWQFINRLEVTLEQNRLDQLGMQAQRIVRNVTPILASVTTALSTSSSSSVVYALPLSSPIILDGYFDDWQILSASPQPIKQNHHIRYLAAENGENLYLFIEYQGKEHDYRPTLPGSEVRSLTQGDYLLLKAENTLGETKTYLMNPFAPGVSNTWEKQGQNRFMLAPEVKSVWQDTRSGFQIELSLPLNEALQGIGFAFVHDSKLPLRPQWQGNLNANKPNIIPRLIFPQTIINHSLSLDDQAYTQITLVDPHGWIWGSSGQLNTYEDASDRTGEQFSLTEKLLISLLRILRFSHPSQTLNLSAFPGIKQSKAIQAARKVGAGKAWVIDKSNHQAIMVATQVLPAPYTNWVIEVAQTTGEIASVTNHAMLNLLSTSLVFVALIILTLLAFAGRLSWRILQLKKQIETSVSSENRLHYQFTPSLKKDELGELSRSYYHLLQELNHYTDYLEEFSRKLSHELKTPLAIVSSSLSNLELQSPPGASDNLYIQRARQGCSRLSQILHTMSEASRLEQSIDHHDKEIFDLHTLVTDIAQAHKSLLGTRSLIIKTEKKPIYFNGSPDLVAQLIDKLMDNARDFTPENGQISMSLSSLQESIRLTICNEGPLLPKEYEGDIFKAFISHRDETQQSGHMGQGLVIVKLIAEFHKGKVKAYNKKDKKGVCFEIIFPENVNRSQK
jgi:dedicated sortase system histidine kinase